PEEPAEPEQFVIRVGLRYGSEAMDGANLANSIGSGFTFGYYDSGNNFVPVGSTAQSAISVVKTENVYYGSYNGYTTYYDHLKTSTIAVGCYHLQLGGSYESFEEAQTVAGAYQNGFVAYIGGKYYARIGNYTDRDSAVAAQSALAGQGISADLKGTSAYGVSVVKTGTNQILFQYDDLGSGTGLGVVGTPEYPGQKCVTLFRLNSESTSWYGGFRYERIDGGDLTIVNMVGVEDYAKGVIVREMSPSWPLEALKAQAVCARNYALYNLNKHRKYHFDICNSTCCQAYGGTNRATAATDAAVDQTVGMRALYDGKPINCVYYSSNGGASEDAAVVWGNASPYLVGKADPFEETVSSMISGYAWTRRYTGDELAAKLRAVGYNCSTITAVEVLSYTDVGNPKQVMFTDSNKKTYKLTARGMVKAFGFRSYRYDLVNGEAGTIGINEETEVDSLTGLYVLDGEGNLSVLGSNSEIYVLTDEGTVTASQILNTSVSGTSFTFSGQGWGHNVGMSQWGAYAMAKLGYTYDQILKFYYTDIDVG
ncbi:MAG: SpoIID/LytB domain-containing protein, partial [Oscillospiraceae bacterium]|nr:SpoIID/LytB domain-containing protein [Oscillospiraceae bacterium]